MRAVSWEASTMRMVLAQPFPLLGGAPAEYSGRRRDVDADRHPGSALPARRAGARARALAPASPPRAGRPAARRQRPVLRGRLPRAAVHHVPADDRGDDAVLRRRARAAAHGRRALEQPAVAGADAPTAQARSSDAGRSSGIDISCGETLWVSSQAAYAAPS